jgi:hypothetical protein
MPFARRQSAASKGLPDYCNEDIGFLYVFQSLISDWTHCRVFASLRRARSVVSNSPPMSVHWHYRHDAAIMLEFSCSRNGEDAHCAEIPAVEGCSADRQHELTGTGVRATAKSRSV